MNFIFRISQSSPINFNKLKNQFGIKILNVNNYKLNDCLINCTNMICIIDENTIDLIFNGKLILNYLFKEYKQFKLTEKFNITIQPFYYNIKKWDVIFDDTVESLNKIKSTFSFVDVSSEKTIMMNNSLPSWHDLPSVNEQIDDSRFNILFCNCNVLKFDEQSIIFLKIK